MSKTRKRASNSRLDQPIDIGHTEYVLTKLAQAEEVTERLMSVIKRPHADTNRQIDIIAECADWLQAFLCKKYFLGYAGLGDIYLDSINKNLDYFTEQEGFFKTGSLIREMKDGSFQSWAILPPEPSAEEKPAKIAPSRKQHPEWRGESTKDPLVSIYSMASNMLSLIYMARDDWKAGRPLQDKDQAVIVYFEESQSGAVFSVNSDPEKSRRWEVDGAGEMYCHIVSKVKDAGGELVEYNKLVKEGVSRPVLRARVSDLVKHFPRVFEHVKGKGIQSKPGVAWTSKSPTP